MGGQTVVYVLSAVGGACWLLCALGNAAVLRAQLGREPDAPAPSFVPLVGAAAGLLAWHAVFDTLATHLGWPDWAQPAGAFAIVMLDFGSGPFLLIALFALLGGLFAARDAEPLSTAHQRRMDAAIGCLLGIAVGDAIGLPAEGLSRRRLGRLLGPVDRHRLVLGRGLCSDDTEHNAMVALSICRSGADVGAFAAAMRARLRWWLLALPAGVGSATARAILKLWLFLPPRWQGVRSAGNGAAMRAPLLGTLFAHDQERLRALVRASTRLTHTDPKAECAALAVAIAAALAAEASLHAPTLIDRLRAELAAFGADGAELLALLERAAASAQAGEASTAFADSLGLQTGVTGYAYHTVPVALHGCLAHPRDYARAVGGVIACGGDTDTVAAITGGIVGAHLGRAGLPAAWLDRLIEWPATPRWLESLAAAAQARVLGLACRAPREHAWLVLLARNLVFLAIVLVHGFRRLLPPW